MKGIIAYANEAGHWHVWNNPNDWANLQTLPTSWRGDGIIAHVTKPELAKAITTTGLPCVDVSDDPVEGFKVPRVRTDDRSGTHLAVQHFIERGIRKFAFVGPTHRANPTWYLEAFKAALATRGHSCHVLPINKNEENILSLLQKWLRELPKPIGILVWGHGHARAVVDACLEAGIAVPHDVAILAGSDDELFSHACFPALSGVQAPTEQIGYQAAKLLHQMMKGGKVSAKTLYIPPRRIVGRLSTDTLAVEDPKLVKVVGFIRKHALESIRMDDILKAVPMSRRSLERQFVQAFGHSPLEEIRRIRIDQARRFLADTDLPMQAIAERCGYATYNYLTNVFKATTGISPRDYRKQFRL